MASSFARLQDSSAADKLRYPTNFWQEQQLVNGWTRAQRPFNWLLGALGLWGVVVGVWSAANGGRMNGADFALSMGVTIAVAALCYVGLALLCSMGRPVTSAEVERARGLLVQATDSKASRGYQRSVVIAAYAVEVNHTEGVRRYLFSDLMERLRAFSENAIDETEFDREACNQMKNKLQEIIADIAYEKGDKSRLDLLCSMGKDGVVWIEVRESLETCRLALRDALNRHFNPLDEAFKKASETSPASPKATPPAQPARQKLEGRTESPAMKRAAKAASKALKAIGVEVEEIRGKNVKPLLAKVNAAVESAQLRHQQSLSRYWFWV